jgi:hypothetical protein
MEQQQQASYKVLLSQNELLRRIIWLIAIADTRDAWWTRGQREHAHASFTSTIDKTELLHLFDIQTGSMFHDVYRSRWSGQSPDSQCVIETRTRQLSKRVILIAWSLNLCTVAFEMGLNEWRKDGEAETFIIWVKHFVVATNLIIETKWTITNRYCP